MNTIQDQLTAAESANKSGNYAEAETTCRQLVAQDLSPEEKAWALVLLSQSLWRRGLAQEALPFTQEALSIAEEIEHKELQAKALGNLGGIYFHVSDYPRTLEYYHRAMSIFEELGNKSGLAGNLGNLGSAYSELSDYARALECYQQALAIDEVLGNKIGVAINLANIGSVYLRLSDYARALEYFHQALAIFEELNNKSAVAKILGNLGVVYRQLSDDARALEYYHQALTIFEEIDNKSGMAINLGNLGNAYSDISDYARALEYFHQSMTIEEELGNRSGVAVNLNNIGKVYRTLSDYPRALEYYQQALAIEEGYGRKYGVAKNLGNLGDLYTKSDFADYNPAKAEAYLLRSIAISQELGTKQQLYEVYKSLADLYKQESRWQEHAEYLQLFYDVRDEVQSEETKKLADKFAFQRQIAVMEKEREVTDMLLHKFLPSPIINEVKAKEGKILVQQFNSISVLFADLVGFTKLSLAIKPETMIEMLNYIFTKFDTIIKEAGGHRLRTIGDGYFAICGAPDLVENHQYKLAKAALKFMEDIFLPEHIKKYLPEGTILDIRIGLHCGEAVCGMVGGLEKWQYDAYGDTINTASRMESHGEAGKIHISEDFKNSLLDYDEFTFLPREPMFIKGKGMMNTYFLQ